MTTIEETITIPEKGDEPTPSDTAETRKRDCEAAIHEVLVRYRCRIEPFSIIEAVGVGHGQKALITPAYGLVAEAPE
jgi:hypothetical protein